MGITPVALLFSERQKEILQVLSIQKRILPKIKATADTVKQSSTKQKGLNR
jgi:DNA-directed RNA polymerase subunit H (RpoH/RPB5)